MQVTPPKHLQSAGRELFRAVAIEFAITDPAGLALLATACESLDRLRQAQREITKHGLFTVDRYGQRRASPAHKVEVDSRNAMLAALRQLHLEIEPDVLSGKVQCLRRNDSEPASRATNVRQLRSPSTR